MCHNGCPALHQALQLRITQSATSPGLQHQWIISERKTWSSTERRTLDKAGFQQMSASLPPSYLQASPCPPADATHQDEDDSPARPSALPSPTSRPARPPKPPSSKDQALKAQASPSDRHATRADEPHEGAGTSREGSACGSGVGSLDEGWAATGALGRLTDQDMARRNQERAWESVQALLAECAFPNDLEHRLTVACSVPLKHSRSSTRVARMRALKRAEALAVGAFARGTVPTSAGREKLRIDARAQTWTVPARTTSTTATCLRVSGRSS